MPKPKPDQVIRHEIILGRVERDLVETATMAYTVNRVATPLVALLSDISAMTIILSLVATYLGFKYEVPQLIGGQMADLYADFDAQFQAAKDKAEAAGESLAYAQINSLPFGIGPIINYLRTQGI